jgi:hypothetical protein
MPHNWPFWGAMLGTLMYILGDVSARHGRAQQDATAARAALEQRERAASGAQLRFFVWVGIAFLLAMYWLHHKA